MSDNKVSVKEALEKLYDLSWMVGSTAMEYLTDKDGEKIRDYVGVIEDRINDLEKELSEFKKYFEPYDIDEETAEAIIRSKCPNIDSAKDYIQSRLAEDDPMNFSVGKIVHDLMAKELTEDVKKQILEENSKMNDKTSIGGISIEVKAGLSVGDETARICMDLLAVYF